MAGVKSFTDLKCWQMSRSLSKEIFWKTKERDFCHDRRLVEQINDSTESVMSNVAEGFGRGTQEEFINFLGYAIGSLDETRSHLCAAFDRKHLSTEQYTDLWERATEVRRLIVAFLQSMNQGGGGVKFRRKQQNWTEIGWERFERITGQQRPALFEALRQDPNDNPKPHGRPP